MSAVLTNPVPQPQQEAPGLWTLAWRRLKQDGVGMFSLAVVAFFLILMAASYAGIVAKDWSKEKGVSDEDLKRGITANIPLSRIVTDDECARAALFLVSDYSSGMTGSVLDSNGGEALP